MKGYNTNEINLICWTNKRGTVQNVVAFPVIQIICKSFILQLPFEYVILPVDVLLHTQERPS